MKKAILFDLGNTLIQYYERNEFPEILRQAISGIYIYLQQNRAFDISFDAVWERVKIEDHESKDYSVRPLEERLKRIFSLENTTDDFMLLLCRYFMKPIFSISKLYDDTIPTLNRIKKSGFKTAIITNTTWGSPSVLWREEIARYGIDEYIDLIVSCRDVGWRKPDRRIFEYAIKFLEVSAKECIFIGDDPRWDIAGPKSIGIYPVLIDRKNMFPDSMERRISTLTELPDILGIGNLV